MAGSSVQVSKPMSVSEIAVKAQDFEFNPFIALKYWLRTADTLLREAHIYEQEDNDQQAYLLLMRYATLVTEKFPSHPEVGLPEYKVGVRAARKTLPPVLDAMELLKPRIDARHSAWQKSLERRREAETTLAQERGTAPTLVDAATSDPAVAGNTTTLGAAENSELAVRLAHQEIRRRETKRKSNRQASLLEKDEQERRTAGLWDDWEAALSGNRTSHNDAEIQQNMEASRRRLDGSQDMAQDGAKKPASSGTPQRRSQGVKPKLPKHGSTEYRYPTISKSLPLSYQERLSDSASRPPSPEVPDRPPKPPKQYLDTSDYEPAPERPAKASLDSHDTEPAADPASSFTFRPSAYLENGKPLRTVFLPPTLRESFLQIAAPNTRNNLETCGMLCGTLISNALFISKLVIPEQKSTSDTCETTNEGALFDYCSSEDLMVLGWIHTHPSQTCFMSSRDLHTHCGYQVMMSECIAIVCAPSKNPSWGVFRLTDPPGMQSVLNCRRTGLFHPHDETNIYTDALRPGHVFEADGLHFEVIDMRPT